MSHDPWATQQQNTYAPADDFSDLDSFGRGEFAAKHAFAVSIDSLPDGAHDCEIDEANLIKTQTGVRLLKLNLKVNGGTGVEWTHWLNDQRSINALCADLVVLNFDADKWGEATNRPLSVEVPKVIPKLKGLKFRGLKTTDKGKENTPNAGKVWHKFRVLCRLDGRPMPPLSPPGAGTPVPAPHTPPPMPTGAVQFGGQAPMMHNPHSGANDIPF